jgi:hypothetical protein
MPVHAKMCAEYFNTFRTGRNRGRVGRKRGRTKEIKKKGKNGEIRGWRRRLCIYISATLQRTYLMQIPATGFESQISAVKGKYEVLTATL